MRHQPGHGDGRHGAYRPHSDAHASHPARPPGQDLRHALGLRLQESSIRFARRQAHSMGQLHHQQGACHSPAVQLGDDMCLRPLREFRRLRGARQHMLYIQFKNPRGQRASFAGAARPHRLSVVLPLPGRQPDSDQLRRHVLRSVGHRDRTAVRFLHRSHRGRDVPLSRP